MRKTFGKIHLICQKINAKLGGKRSKQYKINIVSMIQNTKLVDRWCVIEAPYDVKRKLYTRILEIVGKCRLIG